MEENVLQALTSTYSFIIPEMVLGAGACVLFLAGTMGAGRRMAGGIALGTLILSGVIHFATLGKGMESLGPAVADAARFNGPLWPDGLGSLVRLIALGGGAILVLFSWNEVPDRQAADYHACLLLIVAGLCFTGAANDLIVLFLALELVSIPTYILLYLPKHDNVSQEAALKYFLLSVFSSSLTLFGFSYLYGLVGATNLATLHDTLNRAGGRDMPAIANIAVITVIAGLGFKMTIVPFHFYAPDVYQGTSTAGAAFLAFIPKVAGFVALLRVLGFVTPHGIAVATGLLGMGLSTQVPIILWFLSVLTMVLGNILALWQSNLKRLLAYSSVAHAGYMLVGLAIAPYLRNASGAADVDGVEAILYYLVAYGAMTIGAFAVIAYLDSPESPVETIDDLAGLSSSHPGLALVMTLFLFSLIGIPLTAGFTGKFLVFFGAMAVPLPEQAWHAQVLAIIGMLNAAVGGWYYLRVVAVMYLRNPLRTLAVKRSVPALATLAICAVLTVGLSVPPGASWLLQAAREAAGVKKVADERQAGVLQREPGAVP